MLGDNSEGFVMTDRLLLSLAFAILITAAWFIAYARGYKRGYHQAVMDDTQ